MTNNFISLSRLCVLSGLAMFLYVFFLLTFFLNQISLI